jgi:hypothetical protein
MGLLYGRAGRLDTKNGGFRPGQVLAGFCVDYIVHLAHSFNECEDSSRVARVEYAVGHMGISVLGGCLTSLGASALLFFCTLQVTCLASHSIGIENVVLNNLLAVLLVLWRLLLRHDHPRCGSHQCGPDMRPAGLTQILLVAAWIWANFFFVPLLGTLGPEGNTGDFYGWMIPKRGEDGSSGGADVNTNDVVVNPMDEKSPDDQASE